MLREDVFLQKKKKHCKLSLVSSFNRSTKEVFTEEELPLSIYGVKIKLPQSVCGINVLKTLQDQNVNFNVYRYIFTIKVELADVCFKEVVDKMSKIINKLSNLQNPIYFKDVDITKDYKGNLNREISGISAGTS